MIPLQKSLLVFVGGGLGATARYWLGIFVQNRIDWGSFPLGTFLINITGSLLIGLMTGLLLKSASPENTRLLVVVGLLGGYTTFSSFSLEAMHLLTARSYWLFALYVVGSVMLSLIAAGLGLLLARAFAA